jgi:hypothetical protein
MKRLYGFLTAALTALLLVVNVAPASAANSSGLSIAPRKDYKIDAGTTIHDKLTVGNLDGSATLSLNVKMIDFTFMDTSGTPKLFTAANAPQTTWSLKPFTTLPSTVTVAPHQTTSINFDIHIPAGQGAGSYYGAVVYSAGDAGNGNVDLAASGVTLVFVSVPGTVNENMSLKKFGAYIQSDKTPNSGNFVFVTVDKPKELAYTLANSGNVAEQPVGSIELRNMFGGKDIQIQNANPHSSLALRGQTRLFEACINPSTKAVELASNTAQATTCENPSLLPGRYTAKLDVFYGQNGNQTHEVTAIATFWYLPWWFIIAVLIIIALLTAFVWWLQRKIRMAINGGRPKRFRR